jgi:hypothetical protein
VKDGALRVGLLQDAADERACAGVGRGVQEAVAEVDRVGQVLHGQVGGLAEPVDLRAVVEEAAPARTFRFGQEGVERGQRLVQAALLGKADGVPLAPLHGRVRGVGGDSCFVLLRFWRGGRGTRGRAHRHGVEHHLLARVEEHVQEAGALERQPRHGGTVCREKCARLWWCCCCCWG